MPRLHLQPRAPSLQHCGARSRRLPARTGGIWVSLAKHRDLLPTIGLWDVGVAQEDVGINQEKL